MPFQYVVDVVVTEVTLLGLGKSLQQQQSFGPQPKSHTQLEHATVVVAVLVVDVAVLVICGQACIEGRFLRKARDRTSSLQVPACDG